MPSRLGAPNKRRDLLEKKLREEFPNYNAVVEMARMANDPAEEPQLRFQAHKEVAQYVFPKLRAVEVTGADGGPVVAEIILRPHD